MSKQTCQDKLTEDQLIAQQFLVEHWEKPMRIPDQFSGSGNRIADADIDEKHFSLILYHFNYGKKKGMAEGLWLLSDLIKNNYKECQLAVRLA